MQFFGDKYGDIVRVVQIGGQRGEAGRLFDGTLRRHAHARDRRDRFVPHRRRKRDCRRRAAHRSRRRAGSLSQWRTTKLQLIKTLAGKVNSPVHELEKKIEALLAHQKELEKQVKAAHAARTRRTPPANCSSAVQTVNGIPLIIHNLGDADGDFLQAIADSLKGRFKGVIVLGGAANGAVALVAAVSPDFTAKIQAGKIIQQIAPIVGGKGGGKPDNARGGGKDATQTGRGAGEGKELARLGVSAHIAFMLADEQTSPEQFAILRRMTPARRLALAEGLYWTAREMKRSWLRAQHADWSEEQVARETARIFRHART